METEHPEHNPGEPEFGEHSEQAPHNPGEPTFGDPDESESEEDQKRDGESS